jgi:hypothetical protein
VAEVLISQRAGAKERRINSEREINIRAWQAAATIAVGAVRDCRDFCGVRWLEGRGKSR